MVKTTIFLIILTSFIYGQSLSDLEKLTLEEILNIEVVSVVKKKQFVKNAPASVYVITQDQIKKRGYYDLDDALEDLPAFDLIRVYGAFPTLRTIRGNYGDENKRILLLIDGIVENSIIGGFSLGGPVYSLHNVERIEVVLGPASALYGANAYSGIINIITKHGKKHEGFSYETMYGSWNTRAHLFELHKSSETLDFSISGSLYNTDGPAFENRHPEFSDAFVDNGYSLVSRLTYRNENHTSTLGFHIYDQNMGDGTFGKTHTAVFGIEPAGHFNNPENGFLSSDINGKKASHWHPSNRTLFLMNDYKLNNKILIHSNLYYRDGGVHEDMYSYFQVGEKLFQKNKIMHYSYKIAGELQVDYDLNLKQSFTFGLQYAHNNIEKGYRAFNQDTSIVDAGLFNLTNVNATFREREFTIQNNIGLYSQFVYKTDLFKRTDFIIGARYDNNSEYGSTFNPRTGIIIRPSDNFNLKLLYGTAYRAPTNFELYSGYSIVRQDNPDLKPEKIMSYEFGVSYLKDFFHISWSLFYNKLEDIIISTIPVKGELAQNRNQGKANLFGSELNVNLILSDKSNLFLNFSFQNENENSENQYHLIHNIPNIKGNLGFDIELDDFLSTHISLNWIGPRNTAPTNPLQEIPSYISSNLALYTQNLFNNNISLSLRINNLFDVEYFDPGIRSGDGKSFWPTVHEQPGRNVFLKLSYNIK